jgi:FkbM family methyltransferase
LRQTLSKLVSYASLFGWARSLALVARESVPPRPRRTTIAVPRSGVELRVRLGTTDLLTVAHVFGPEGYDLDYGVSPRLIIDAGANLGASSVFFAQRFREAVVLALEPEPENFELMSQNVEPWPQIRPLACALWSEEATLELFDPGIGHWGFRVRESSQVRDKPGTGIAVQALPIARLLELAGADRIGLLKLDIEGAEREVLNRACGWIDRVDTLVAELHDRYRPGCSAAFARATADFPVRFERGENVVARRA